MSAAGVASASRAELRKLAAQLSTRVLALVCLLGPLAFALVLSRQGGVPADTLLGVWVHTSGYAVAFVVLGFAGYLGAPVLAGALAGDMFSGEDRHGTWKTLLTRSRSRGEVFAGKALAAGALTTALLALAALSSILAGLLFTGGQPMIGLGGQLLSSGEALWLALLGWLLVLPGALAFTSLALLCSIATRNGVMGVLGPVLAGLAMQLLALLGNGTWVHALLVSSALEDWHGLLAHPSFYGPALLGTLVSLLWIAACLGAAWLILRAREFAGPPLSRRPGWVVPLRAVLAAALVLVALAAGTGLGAASVTKGRLEASVASAFRALTLRQQRELGRPAPPGARVRLRTSCSRRSGASQGPGDDWVCTLTVVSPLPGINPFQLTPVTYDLNVRSEGCWKAEAPPAFVGQQTMRLPNGRTAVNPLFTIYGCFDPTASSPPPVTAHSPRSPQSAPPSGASERARERQALREAERTAGPAVVREIGEAERQAQRETEHPVEEEALTRTGR